MSENLNPCPECGAEAQIIEPFKGIFLACCSACGLHYKTFDNKETAASTWNERTLNARLKPCPFCGGYAHLLRGSSFSHEYWYVACDRCLAETRQVNSPDNAIHLWNKRKGGEA